MGNMRKIYLAFLALCTTLMFSLSFSNPELVSPELFQTEGYLYKIIENMRQSLTNDLFTMSIMFAIFYYISIKVQEKRIDNMFIIYLFNFILAAIWLISESFCLDDTTVNLNSTAGQIVKSVIYIVGATHLLNCIAKILYEFLCTQRCIDSRDRFYNKNPFCFWFIVMLVVWMPNTIISYPASIEMDVWDSLYQFFGRTAFTNHHPAVFTALIGWFASFGLALGNINIGFFMWTLIQTVICAAIMAYDMATMKKLHTPSWLIKLTFLIAALSPLYTSYITTIVKDTMFSFASLLYLTELIYMHIDWKEYWKSRMHICLFTSANLFMLLFRHNGKYVIIAMLLYLLIRCVKYRREVSNRYILKYAFFLILPLVLAKIISSTVISYYDVTIQEGESLREALSIPFQQSARYSKYYGQETPEEEKAVIDTVIDYYALADVYEPAISDPVKSRFHYYATKQDWIAYFKVWFKQFTRHPLTYFGATLDQNYYLLYPMKENSRLYYSTYVDYFYDHDFMDELGAAQDMTFAEANDVRISFYKLMHSFPVIGAFSNIAVYNIILLYLILFSIKNKIRGFFWITFPAILDDLVVVAGPAIYDNIRYALPVVYAIPIITAYFIYLCTNEDRNVVIDTEKVERGCIL